MPNTQNAALLGRLAYRTVGIIKALGHYGEKFSVGKIEYEHFDDESFQYIISPFWDIIDSLPNAIFAGIPGIKLEKRLASYYRVNFEPVFITERTPSKNREDLWDLLESVGLDYYDRLEWLIRTPMRAANDNLIVERMRDTKEKIDFRSYKKNLNHFQYGDEISVEYISDFGKTPGMLAQTLAAALFAGIDIRVESEHKVFSEIERTTLIPFIIPANQTAIHERKALQAQGISIAKQKGKYKGRPKTAINRTKFEEALKKFKAKQINIEEAMSMSGVSSRSTFYRRIGEQKL